MANMRYFPRRGTTREVGGMISTTSRKNTYKLVRIEMDNVTCNAEKERGDPLILLTNHLGAGAHPQGNGNAPASASGSG